MESMIVATAVTRCAAKVNQTRMHKQISYFSESHVSLCKFVHQHAGKELSSARLVCVCLKMHSVTNRWTVWTARMNHQNKLWPKVS